MKARIGLLALASLTLFASVQADERIEGRVVEHNTNAGIEDVVVRLIKLNNEELAKAETNDTGEFLLELSQVVDLFHLRYDPPDKGSDGYYVAGRTYVDRSGSEMVVDTMGLVSKQKTDVDSSAKQQRDAAGYVDAGGDEGKTRMEIEFAQRTFGDTYREAHDRQPWVLNYIWDSISH